MFFLSGRQGAPGLGAGRGLGAVCRPQRNHEVTMESLVVGFGFDPFDRSRKANASRDAERLALPPVHTLKLSISFDFVTSG